MFGANQTIVKDLTARKKKEYQNSVELIRISKLYEMHKVLQTQEYITCNLNYMAMTMLKKKKKVLNSLNSTN